MSSIGALCTLISNQFRECFLLLVTETHRGRVLVAAAVPSHVHNLGVESLDWKGRRVPSLAVPTLVWSRLQIYLRTLRQDSPRTSSCCFWLLVPAALLHSQVYVPSWADWACPRYSSLPTANTCARPFPSPGRG